MSPQIDNKIDLLAIEDIAGMNFVIPDYQRGYRWSKQQVKDLLDDIEEFMLHHDKENSNEIYCIQPLVVMNRFKETELLTLIHHSESIQGVKDLIKKETAWEVIDGQQRLTTIYLLLQYLGENNFYSLEYTVRKGSEKFLRQIDFTKHDDNIDYYHICQTLNTIKEWFDSKEKERFKSTLLKKVKFIWYESTEAKPINVFTRLNIGKIGLTNSELIKALILNSSNFDSNNQYDIRIRQQEIALQWDDIENKFEDDQFWLFLHKKDEKFEMRIDWLFNIICEKNLFNLNLSDNDLGEKEKDKYRTFRYFYHKFRQKNSNQSTTITEVWSEIMKLFNCFNEWYNDVLLFHYIGYLVELGDQVEELYYKWEELKVRNDFLNNYIIPRIRRKLKYKLEQHYEGETVEKKAEPPKTGCKPTLLLYNIQSIINENLRYENASKYQIGVFRKFPFHLYKTEKWDVEHIDSHKQNNLEDEMDKRDYLLSSLTDIKDKETIISIIDYLKASNTENTKKFEELFKKIENIELGERDSINDTSAISILLSENEKDMIWNFALLDQGTNRSYKNAIFPAKRRTIIGKNQGQHSDVLVIDQKLSEKLQSTASVMVKIISGRIEECKSSKDAIFKLKSENGHLMIEIIDGKDTPYIAIERIMDFDFVILTRDGVPAFVPQCTLNVFTKYYSLSTNKLREWSKSDAEAYKASIKLILQNFIQI